MKHFFPKLTTATKKRIGYSILFLLCIWFWFCLPSPLFKNRTSTVLEDNTGKLLAARIADDGQWRFPKCKTVPYKFVESIIQFEDREFFAHKGFNPMAFTRAFIQNIKARKIISGGSTLSMQVIRLARKGKSRSITEKLIEIIYATRLELTYSKFEILSLYASNAPYGSNVVGIDAASWRYFGREAEGLSCFASQFTPGSYGKNPISLPT